MTKEIFITKTASYIYAEAVLESSEGSWNVHFDKIAKNVSDEYEIDAEMFEAIEEKLRRYEGVADVEYDNDCFSVIIYTDYILSDYGLDEEEE